jgi:hypothetical protein
VRVICFILVWPHWIKCQDLIFLLLGFYFAVHFLKVGSETKLWLVLVFILMVVSQLTRMI